MIQLAFFHTLGTHQPYTHLHFLLFMHYKDRVLLPKVHDHQIVVKNYIVVTSHDACSRSEVITRAQNVVEFTCSYPITRTISIQCFNSSNPWFKNKQCVLHSFCCWRCGQVVGSTHKQQQQHSKISSLQFASQQSSSYAIELSLKSLKNSCFGNNELLPTYHIL